MMQRILVTGATGFIGRYLISELLSRKVSVIASSVHEAKARQQSWFSEVKYIPFDLKQFDARLNYYEFFEKPDAMIHLAWEGLPNYKAAFHLEENLPRHYSFLSNMITNGLRDLTVTGTCFEYGMKDGMLREDMEPVPANAYAVAKDELRKYLSQLQSAHPFTLKWVRLFYMYGKGQNPNSLISQLDAALERGDGEFNMSGGEQVRDFLPVTEVAANIAAIALQQQITGIINCCSGRPVKVSDFVTSYLEKAGGRIKLKLGVYPYANYEPMRFWGDTSRLLLATQPGNHVQ